MDPPKNHLRKVRNIISTLVFIPGPIILALGIVWLLTNYIWIQTTLMIIAGVFFVISIMLVGLKTSGFYKVIRNIKNGNPGKSNTSIIQIGGVLAMWTIIAILFVGIPGLIAFNSTNKEILANLNDFIKYFKDMCPWEY